jgi:hypothetical protein
VSAFRRKGVVDGGAGAEGWKDGRVEGWKSGRMEEWKDEGVSAYRRGRMEGEFVPKGQQDSALAESC